MQERLKKIKIVLMDVDGVLTDGRIVYDNQGNELKFFDVKDGHGLKLLQRAGYRIGIITGRQSLLVERRAQELGAEFLFQGVKDKAVPFRRILEEQQCREEEIAYIGDDLIDLPVLLRAGVAVAVSDAVDEVKAAAHYVTSRPGGRGAVREFCDLLLKAAGRWEQVTDRYFNRAIQ